MAVAEFNPFPSLWSFILGYLSKREMGSWKKVCKLPLCRCRRPPSRFDVLFFLFAAAAHSAHPTFVTWKEYWRENEKREKSDDVYEENENIYWLYWILISSFGCSVEWKSTDIDISDFPLQKIVTKERKHEKNCTSAFKFSSADNFRKNNYLKIAQKRISRLGDLLWFSGEIYLIHT